MQRRRINVWRQGSTKTALPILRVPLVTTSYVQVHRHNLQVVDTYRRSRLLELISLQVLCRCCLIHSSCSKSLFLNQNKPKCSLVCFTSSSTSCLHSSRRRLSVQRTI